MSSFYSIPGPAGTIQIGTVTKLAPAGTPTVTNVGTAEAAILNFGIPQGDAGLVSAAGLGTAAAPSISFDADPNTGIYSPGADQLAISTNGEGRLFVDASGRIGVGTSSPSRNFVLTGSSVTYLKVTEASLGETATDGVDFMVDSAANAYLWNRENGTFQFGTNNTERLRITSAGLVGIGTSAPAGLLHTSVSSTTDTSVIFQNPSTADTATSTIYLSNGTIPTTRGAYIRNGIQTTGSSDRYLAFGVNNTGQTLAERLRITSIGLGIGTTSPAEFLDISPSADVGAILLGRIPYTTYGSTLYANGYIATHVTKAGNSTVNVPSSKIELGNGPVVFYTSPNATAGSARAYTETARIDSAGRLGIGTSPSKTLDVVGDAKIVTTSATQNILLGVSSGGIGYKTQVDFGHPTVGARIESERLGANTQSSLSLWTTSSAGVISRALTIDQAQRLLVGISTSRGNWYNTTGLDDAIQIEGTTHGGSGLSITRSNNFAGHIELGSHGGTTLGSYTLVSSTANLGSISFQGADGAQLVEGASIYAVVDGTPGADDMPGRLVFSTTADGASSPTEQLRITSDRYVRLASGTGGIQFNGDTAAANALDDYEEGAWTPVYAGSTTAGTPTYQTNSQSGKYIKIGKFVQVLAYLDVTNIGGAVGNVNISGLPFTADCTLFGPSGIGTGHADGSLGNSVLLTHNATTVALRNNNAAVSVSTGTIYLSFTYRAL